MMLSQKMLTLAAVSLSMLMIAGTVEAKKEKDISKKGKSASESIEPYKFYNTFIPVLAANPTMGTMVGAAVSSAITLGDPKNTKMSTISANAIYTSKKQIMFLVKSVGYTDNNDWMFIEDGRIFFSSQDTYGLGTGRNVNGKLQKDVTEENGGQPMDFDLSRLYFTLAKKIRPSLYFGVGLHYDKYNKIVDKKLDLANGITTSHYDYSIAHGFDPKGYVSAAVSLNLIYDTRDNVTTPRAGTYAFASYKQFPKSLGNDQSASSIWLEFRKYFSLSKKDPRKLLALWSYANSVTSGVLPYMSLPSLGWDQFGRSGRGYTQGRFRGEDIFYTELELRMPLHISKKHPERYGYVVFANMTSASDDSREQKVLKNFQYGAGVGLRILLNKKSRAFLDLDIAFAENKESSFYLNLGSTF